MEHRADGLHRRVRDPHLHRHHRQVWLRLPVRGRRRRHHGLPEGSSKTLFADLRRTNNFLLLQLHSFARQGACDDGLPVCLAACWVTTCEIEHPPPLDSTECGCVATCLTTAASGGNHPCSATGAGITENEANQWITDGCPAAPCNFQALMAAAKQAVDNDNLDLLARTDVYAACDGVATRMQDTNIVASCALASLHASCGVRSLLSFARVRTGNDAGNGR